MDLTQDHHQYGPSGLEIREHCPCFVQNEDADMSAADEGTMLHEAAEHENYDLCETDEQLETVKRAVAKRNEIVDAFVSEFSDGDKVSEYREQKLRIGEFSFGTGDHLVLAGNKALLADYKFGRNPVSDAEYNLQGQAYVLGVFTEFPSVQEVHVYFICPRVDIVSFAVYTKDDIPRISARIRRVIDRCESEHKSETPHEKACRNCGRKAECKAINSVALAVGQSLGLPLPSEFDAGSLITPHERAIGQALSYILEDWAKQVRRTNTDAAVSDGIEIPDFALRKRDGKLSISESANAIAKVQEHYGIELEHIHQACTLSFSQLADQLFTQLDGPSKEEVRASLRDALKDFIVQGNEVTYLQRKRGKKDGDIIREQKEFIPRLRIG